MTLRVDITRLPEDVQHSITAGEPVELECEGNIVATVHPSANRGGTRLWVALAKLPPLDPDFERDIEEGLKALEPQPFAWEL